MLFSAQRVCCSACPLALGSSGSMCINSEDVARCKGVACFCRAIVESMRTRLVTQTGNSQIIHPMRQSAFIQASIMHRLSCKKVRRKLRICVLLFLINTPYGAGSPRFTAGFQNHRLKFGFNVQSRTGQSSTTTSQRGEYNHDQF